MNPLEQFETERDERVARQGADTHLQELTRGWQVASARHGYSYNFTWLGRPIIQRPEDIVAVQELIWSTRPRLIVETGVAHGGSLLLSASILELLGGDGRVVGIDVDIRDHNRQALDAHPLRKRIELLVGSSIDGAIVDQVRALAKGVERVLVILDSMHTGTHVLEELRAYSPLVRTGGSVIVFDTSIALLPEELYANRPWTKTDNPATAVGEFLRGNDRFVVDGAISDKLLVSAAPGGFLRCVKD